MIKKIVITSNKYSFCLAGFQKQINKYWEQDGLEFTVLGFKEPDITLQDNFKFVLAGPNMSDATIWRDALNPYFQSLDEDYFFLAFEDHFLVDNVNIDLLKKAEHFVKNDSEIGKVRLLPRYKYTDEPRVSFNDLEPYDDDFYLAPKAAGLHLHSSLRPSIWRKDFFIKLLNNSSVVSDPWDFEKNNNDVIFTEKVILPRQEYPIYPDFDAMSQGRPQPRAQTPGRKDMNYYDLTLKPEDWGVFASVAAHWSRG